MNTQKKSFLGPIRGLLASTILLIPMAGNAVTFPTYKIREIPTPLPKVSISGTVKAFCVGVNQPSRVGSQQAVTAVCNLTVWKNAPADLFDRGSPSGDLLASYVYTWNSATNATTWLSPMQAGQIDLAYAINDNGVVAGSTKAPKDVPRGVIC